MSLEVALFPCLSDNYGFLLHDAKTGATAAIDTPDAREIAAQCEARGWTLTEIWNTHWHPDHAGGNVAVKRRYDCLVRGPQQDAIPVRDITHSGGDAFEFAGHAVNVIHTPGHTDEHIIYHIPTAEIAFVGDTIFTLGCGRLFEGTPEEMWESLSRIMALPDATKLYCAHEYTLSNAKFAISVDGENPNLLAAIADAKAKRADGKPTVPTTVGVEKHANPFVTAGSAAELGRRRALKDNF
ncbi:MAG: hydroxyacylglutathione hydrolase [Litorimonas sp.]